MREPAAPHSPPLFLPWLRPIYRLLQPLGWLSFRIIIGGLLMVEGWPKIQSPFAQAAFVENMVGLWPGWLFSPLLAVMQFVGGLMIVLGLFTRPAALVNALMLAVTIWFHLRYPYGDALLTAEGIEFLRQHAEHLTEAGQARLLTDGGAAFLHQVQSKAVFNSIFWTAGATLIALFGSGALSLDRRLIKREF